MQNSGRARAYLSTMRQIALVCQFVLLAAVIALPSVCSAWDLTLDQFSVVVGDADEFFTDVWGDPADFDSVCDSGNDNFVFAPKSAENGIWTAYNPEASGPVFGPMPIPVLGTPLVYREDCTKQGLHYPLDASKYTELSYKIKLSSTSALGVLWSYDRNYALSGFYASDIYYLDRGAVPVPGNEWWIHTFNLPLNAPSYAPWSGWITGLSLHPSTQLQAGSETSLDWIRVYDPQSSPTLNISWSTQAYQGSIYTTALFVDSDTSGYDGVSVARGLPLTGSYSLPTGSLAPGKYYIYAGIEMQWGTQTQIVSVSEYAGPLVINGKPTLRFTAPSRMSGQEYAATERGDAWDMNESTDVVNLDLPPDWDPELSRGFHDWSFANGHFFATSDYDPMGAAVSVDTHMVLPTADNALVDTNRYRYFCYRMQIDSSTMPRDLDLAELNDRGWVARFIYSHLGVEGMFGSTGGHDVVERSIQFPDYEKGFTTYCFDLWDDAIFDTGPTWRQVGAVDVVRFDPLESQPATSFAIDFAGLYAENETDDSAIYNLSWTAGDPDGDALDISFYYDTDRENFDGTLIATLEDVPLGQGSYTWNAQGVPDGTYYVYAVLGDGFNTSKFYSEVPIRVVFEPAPPEMTQYVLWNGFLDMINILELVNRSSETVSVNVSVYDISGQLAHEMELPIAGGGQYDLILNNVPGFQRDSYGLVKLRYQGDSVEGRVSFYRSGALGADYEFAFAVPFTDPNQGTTSVSFNTYQPSLRAADVSQVVAQWLSIVNLNQEQTKRFTVKRYNAAGVLLSSRVLEVGPFQRVDIEAGHQDPGPMQVGLNEIVPEDAESCYLAHLVRYGEKAGGGYGFAFPLLAASGSGELSWMPISNAADGDNWVEIVNGGDVGTDVSIELYDNTGARVWQEDMRLEAHAQQHIHASAFLGAGVSGAAKVEPHAQSARVIGQSMFYFRNTEGAVEAMYGSQAWPPVEGIKFGSYNLFLGMENWLRVFNTSAETQQVAVTLIYPTGETRQEMLTLGAYSGTVLALHDTAIHGTAPDSYGQLTVSGNTLAELVRMRPDPAGGLDFAMPTTVW